MGSPLDSKLAAGLKAAREKQGLTQDKLATKLNVSVQSVSNWEQGIAAPKWGTLRQLQDLYNCSIGTLAGDIKADNHDTQFIMDETGLSEEAVEVLRHDKASRLKEEVYVYEDYSDDFEREEALTYLRRQADIADLLSFLITAQHDNGHRPIADIVFAINANITSLHNLKILPPAARNLCHETYTLLSKRTDPALDRSFHNREKLYKELILHEVNEHKEELLQAYDEKKSLEEIASEMAAAYWDEVDNDPEKVKERQYYLTRDLLSIIHAYVDKKDADP